MMHELPDGAIWDEDALTYVFEQGLIGVGEVVDVISEFDYDELSEVVNACMMQRISLDNGFGMTYGRLKQVTDSILQAEKETVEHPLAPCPTALEIGYLPSRCCEKKW